MQPTNDVNEILGRHAGDPASCLDDLVPLVYDHLRRLAHAQLRRLRPGETLCTTALVNEGYLKILRHRQSIWRNRGHFMAAAAQAMRHILVDAARRRMTASRGSGHDALPLLVEPTDSQAHAADVLEVHQALDQLAKIDERLCRLVECRFFAGMTEDETAEALGVSIRTIRRDWQRARLWLKRALH